MHKSLSLDDVLGGLDVTQTNVSKMRCDCCNVQSTGGQEVGLRCVSSSG